MANHSLSLSALTPVCVAAATVAQASDGALTIDLSKVDTSVQSGHLKIGGQNPQGVVIGANSRFLTMGGKPWYPVVGEFHYARYPRQEWGDELLKMKAGGISVIATYVFWIYHEEEEGKWDWSGDRDLRAFVELCGKHGLFVIPRLGPWAHGEVRNGGFPDWLLQKCGTNVRVDRDPYLTYVRTFYGQMAVQLKGLLWKDGGPVIGVQLENELTDNPGHLATLKTLARDLGIDVPLYTVTGWMRVKIPHDEVLPVFGGYPDTFWSPQIEGWARESRVNYFFSHNRDDSTIGADLATAGSDQAGESMHRYPYCTAEVGGGMQVSYRRRPVAAADDIAALALAKIGSGGNMQGYYMYHGGANKIGRLSTLNETRATHYPNEMPVINYDFQAPLGQYGQKRDSYDALRVLHLFLHDFGGDLAPLPMTLPEKQPANSDDRDTVRWAVRSDGTRGFLFLNNYQSIETLPGHDQVRFELKLQNQKLRVPSKPIRIPAQSYMIWPINMSLGGVVLQYATAQPLCRVGETCVFFVPDGVAAEFVFKPDTLADANQAVICDAAPGTLLTLLARNGTRTKILLLSQAQARQAYKVNVWGMDRLLLSKAQVLIDNDHVRLQSRNPANLCVDIYPPVKPTASDRTSVFQHVAVLVPTREVPLSSKLVQQAQPSVPVKLDGVNSPLQPVDADFDVAAVWQVRIPEDALETVHKVFLHVNYTGDVARAYLGDRLIDDDFYFGRAWEIGLNRFAPGVLKEGVTLKILPLRNDAPIYMPKDRLPQFNEHGEALDVRSITVEIEYEVVI